MVDTVQITMIDGSIVLNSLQCSTVASIFISATQVTFIEAEHKRKEMI